jgi:hypothetical protein
MITQALGAPEPIGARIGSPRRVERADRFLFVLTFQAT